MLEWDSKASHPWILSIKIKYDRVINNGMPDDKTYELLNNFEEKIMEELKDSDGYLNIGRQTADGAREIYFACSDFRKPSMVLHQLTNKNSSRISLSIDLYKDKYWQSLNRFKPN